MEFSVSPTVDLSSLSSPSARYSLLGYLGPKESVCSSGYASYMRIVGSSADFPARVALEKSAL